MTKSRISRAGVALVSCAVVAALASGPSIAAGAAGSKKAIDAKADRMLKQMSDYLAGLKTFTVTGFSVDEEKLAGGEKIQRTADSEIAVQRPDRLRTMPVGAGEGLGLWYDGKTMTIACKGNNTFTALPAPPTLDGAIDTLHKQFKIDAPGADLLYSNTYDILLEQVNSGRFIGRETIAGVPANHLAFEGDDVDWQIWIQDGPQPLPLRFVITTKTVKDRPQFSVQLSNWNTLAIVKESTFQFQPPAGATSVKSVAASCGAAH